MTSVAVLVSAYTSAEGMRGLQLHLQNTLHCGFNVAEMLHKTALPDRSLHALYSTGLADCFPGLTQVGCLLARMCQPADCCWLAGWHYGPCDRIPC